MRPPPLPRGQSATVSVAGAGIDISALLLGADGKVRSDDDLVFYNHPHHDGVSANGATDGAL
ncbi:hypothetical protein GCM10023080_026970 [Streptomyces pseudoechinosporeus]